MQETDKELANFSCVSDVDIENYTRKLELHREH
jgi:hypothetical protein